MGHFDQKWLVVRKLYDRELKEKILKLSIKTVRTAYTII